MLLELIFMFRLLPCVHTPGFLLLIVGFDLGSREIVEDSDADEDAD